MFNPSREQVRRFFCESWRKHRERLILEGAEATAADLIAEHPEYHALLENPQAAIEREFTPEGGRMNPFLHQGGLFRPAPDAGRSRRRTRRHGMPRRGALARAKEQRADRRRSLSRLRPEEG